MTIRPRLVFQAHFQDHVSPLIEAFNSAMAWGGDAPPLPPDPVFIERNAFEGGGSIRLLPSSQLLGWMSVVMRNHEDQHLERQAREAARTASIASSST